MKKIFYALLVAALVLAFATPAAVSAAPAPAPASVNVTISSDANGVYVQAEIPAGAQTMGGDLGLRTTMVVYYPCKVGKNIDCSTTFKGVYKNTLPAGTTVVKVKVQFYFDNTGVPTKYVTERTKGLMGTTVARHCNFC